MTRYLLIAWTSIVFLGSLTTPAYADETIRAVIFDFNGVMTPLNEKKIVNFISESWNVSAEELKPTLGVALVAVATGRIPENEFWQEYAKSIDATPTTDWMARWQTFNSTEARPNPEMFQLAAALQRQGFQVALLSNLLPSQGNVFKKMRYFEGFNPVVLSYEVGFSKPDEKAYRYILDLLKLAPEACLLIDTNPKSVEAAKKIGMKALLFNSNRSSLNEMRKQLKLQGIHL